MTCPEFVRIDDFLYVKKHTMRYMDTDYSPAYDFVKDGVGTLSDFLKEYKYEVEGYMVNLVGAEVKIVSHQMQDVEIWRIHEWGFSCEEKDVRRLRHARKKAIDDLRRQHPVDQYKVRISVGCKSEHTLFISTHAECEQVMEKLAKVLGSAIRMDEEKSA